MKKIILFLLSISILWIGYSYITIGNAEIQKQDFVISKGDTLYSLPKKLDIPVNSTLYKAWIKMHHSDFNLQLGSYSVGENVTLNWLFDKILSNPLAKDLTITILPGWNIYDIDAYLSHLGIISSGQFINASTSGFDILQKKYTFLSEAKNLEWFLYPDTYRIRPESSVNDIIDTLLGQFKNQIIDKSDISGNTLYKKLILASIVEREEKNSDNKRVVAGILEKRYKEGIAIWADATVCYPFKLTQKECTPAFIGEHIYEKSEYNTRSTPWLPPTPISNVSADTFSATIHPQSSPYYYYLHDNDWNIHYSEDLAWHNSNRVKYLWK